MYVSHQCSLPEILEHPENTTVFLNQTAVFRCEVTGGDVSWRVNGKPTTEETSIARDDLDIVSEIGNPLVKLTIIARAEYNGTTVQCLVNSGFSDRSENVSLRIQGESYDITIHHSVLCPEWKKWWLKYPNLEIIPPIRAKNCVRKAQVSLSSGGNLLPSGG